MKKFLILLVLVGLLVGADPGCWGPGAAQERGKHYPKLAPYSAIRWKNATPEVKVNGTWYELLAINDTPTGEIVKFCKDKEPDIWQKRFEEDLVEMMARMGQQPGEKVTLKLRDPASGTTQVMKDVPNTHANRQAIWQARNQGR